MKVCFDLRALQIGHENRGIGMFAKSLLEHLPADKNMEYVFYAFDKNNPIDKLGMKFPSPYQLVTTNTIKTSVEQPKDFLGMLRLINHRFSNLKSVSPDIFVQFDFNLGAPKWKGIRNIVFGYDLIPLIMKNDYLPSARYAWAHTVGNKGKFKAAFRAIYYRLKYHLSYRTYKRADKVICISEATAETFKDLLDIKPEILDVVHLAPVLPVGVPDYSIVDRFTKPYVFYVGGTDSRKGIQDIVYAYNIVRSRELDIGLILAGNEFKSVKELPNIEGRNAIINSPYREDIHFVGFITDAQKAGLYKKAFAFVFCSSYEGFGMPVIEALSQGCPVISYDSSSIPEISGDAARLVETGNYVKIAEELLRLERQDIRKKLKDRGERQATQFSWQASTQHFVKILSQL